MMKDFIVIINQHKNEALMKKHPQSVWCSIHRHKNGLLSLKASVHFGT